MDTDDSSNQSVRRLIQDAEGKTRAAIEKEVWGALKPKTQERLGRAQLRRLIAAEKTNLDQLEFIIDGEPLPFDEIDEGDLPLLRERGYSLIKTGKSCIIRGEAYVAEWKRRTKALNEQKDAEGA